MGCKTEDRSTVAGTGGTGKQFVGELYNDLHAVAHSYCRTVNGCGTIDATVLLHEAYLKLGDRVWETRAHFFAVAAKAMRQILSDATRRHHRRKIGSGRRETLSEALAPEEDQVTSFVRLNNALSALSKIDDRKSTLLELRFLGGLSLSEIADVRGVSVSTVERELRFARAWLLGQLRGSLEEDDGGGA